MELQMLLAAVTEAAACWCVWLAEEGPEGAVADGWSESAVGGGTGSHEASGSGWTAAERPASEQHPQVT